MAKIGVIMRTKDRPILLQRALQSVTQQTFKDWQLVIVNDGGDPGPIDDLLSALDTELQKKSSWLHIQNQLEWKRHPMSACTSFNQNMQ
jgi:glycosyltransferase involved in cell wall biosynthesis